MANGPAFPPPDLAAALKSPTVATSQHGYNFVATSQAWKMACTPLPSCAALQWPGYATTFIPAQIDGIDVVIQPWMGNCQQFLGRGNFPGGYARR